MMDKINIWLFVGMFAGIVLTTAIHIIRDALR